MQVSYVQAVIQQRYTLGLKSKTHAPIRCSIFFDQSHQAYGDANWRVGHFGSLLVQGVQRWLRFLPGGGKEVGCLVMILCVIHKEWCSAHMSGIGGAVAKIPMFWNLRRKMHAARAVAGSWAVILTTMPIVLRLVCRGWQGWAKTTRKALESAEA